MAEQQNAERKNQKENVKNGSRRVGLLQYVFDVVLSLAWERQSVRVELNVWNDPARSSNVKECTERSRTSEREQQQMQRQQQQKEWDHLKTILDIIKRNYDSQSTMNVCLITAKCHPVPIFISSGRHNLRRLLKAVNEFCLPFWLPPLFLFPCTHTHMRTYVLYLFHFYGYCLHWNCLSRI